MRPIRQCGACGRSELSPVHILDCGEPVERTEKPPVELAARAIEAKIRAYPMRPDSGIPNGVISWGATMSQLAQAALDAAVEDREGLAEVIRKHSKRRVVLGTWECMECGERLPTIDSPRLANVSAHQADAAARWLTGGRA